MSRKLSIITLTLAILAIALSAFTLLSSKNTAGSETGKQPARVTEAATAKEAMDTAGEEEGDIQYVLYLGLSRPDDGSMLTFEEGKEKLQPILVKHFSGFTIQTAYGGWRDDQGVYCEENTLVIYLSDTNIEKVREAADDMIKEFGQSSILIQANKTNTEFYTGK